MIILLAILHSYNPNSDEHGEGGGYYTPSII
jgi:hypothetical protein